MPSPVQNTHEYYRYCPGEEQIRISDAVCLGRQRTAYPKCKDCSFRDRTGVELRSAGLTADMPRKERKSVIESMFKAYDVRATYPDPLNEDAAWKIII